MDKPVTVESNSELIFFDTFSHLNSEDSNLDLIQFATPVKIHEIRVIPLGAKVEADFPGGVRLGATNPSSFTVQFFINDLSQSSSSTFSDIGSFEYQQNVNIQFVIKDPKPTDGLLLKGLYSTLTMAVFGEKTDITTINQEDEIKSPVLSPVNNNKTDFLDPSDNILAKLGEDESLEVLNVIEKCIREEGKKELPLDSYTPPDDKVTKKKSVSPAPAKAKRDSRSSSRASEELKFEKASKTLRTVRKVSRSRSRSPRQYDKYADERRVVKRRSRSPHSSSRRTHSSKSRQSTSRVRESREEPRKYRRSKSPETKRRSYRPSPQTSKSKPRSRSPPRGTVSKSAYLRRHQRSPEKASPPVIQRLKIGTKISPVHSVENVSPATDDHLCETNVKVSPLLPVNEDLLDPISPEHSLEDVGESISPDDLESISEDDACESNPTALESISSGEESLHEELEADDTDIGYIDLEEFDDSFYMWSFDPFSCKFEALKHFKFLSSAEKLEKTKSLPDEEFCVMLRRFQDPCSRTEIWVEAIEELTERDIPPCDIEMAQDLMTWVKDGLNFELAFNQHLTPYKVRHMKAGIRLTIKLIQTNEDFVIRLIDNKIPYTLLTLYKQPFLSLPVKLLILRAIDCLSDSYIGMEHIISHRYSWSEGEIMSTCYQQLILTLTAKPPTRIVVTLNTLLKKVNLFESASLLRDINDTSPVQLDLVSIKGALDDISASLRTKDFMAPPIRYLPAQPQFEVKNQNASNVNPLFGWCKDLNFLSSVVRIADSSHDYEVMDSIALLVSELLKYDQSLEFFLSQENIDDTNALHKYLVKDCDENDYQRIGIKFSFCLEVLRLVDDIVSNQQDGEDALVNCIIPKLHHLYIICSHVCGRMAVIEVLSRYSQCLISLLTGDFNEDSRNKSLAAVYASEILMVLVTEDNDGWVPFIYTHKDELTMIAMNSRIPRLQCLSAWLEPIMSLPLCYTEETFVVLMDVVKKETECVNSVSSKGVRLEKPQLITALRILTKLCVDTGSSRETSELKYLYAVMQFNSLNGLSYCLRILEITAETYLRPSHQSLSLTGTEGTSVLAVISPALSLVKITLSSLLKANGSEFSDCTPVSTLLKVYSLTMVFPSSSVSYNKALNIAESVIDTLLLYTTLFVGEKGTEVSLLSKSIWSRMLEEVLKYTLASPMTFTHGLSVLSELLPLPLPFQVKELPTTEEAGKLMNSRKLWTAHVHLVSRELEKIIQSLASSNNAQIQELLRRICVQLCELSATTASFVGKCILDSVCDETSGVDYNSGTAENCVLLFAFLTGQPTFRITLISTLNNHNKKDEKYYNLIHKLLVILQEESDKLCFIKSAILEFLHPLCDAYISFADGSNDDQALSNSLIPKDIMQAVTTCLLKFLGKVNMSPHMSLELASLRILALICENDIGLWLLRQSVLAINPFPQLFKKLLDKFDENWDVNVAYSKILTVLYSFVKALVTKDASRDKLCFSKADLVKLLNWKNEEDKVELENQKHTLEIIQENLVSKENIKLTELSKWLIAYLEDTPLEESIVIEPILPSHESLATQFAKRPTFVITTELDMEQLKPSFWLSLPSADERDARNAVKADLIALSNTYCGTDFEFKTCLEELCKHPKVEVAILKKSDHPSRKFEFLISAKETVPFGGKRPYQAPMRGRGFRQSNAHNRGNDLFRSRPPNTSRPPSMHVDDFVAMEKQRDTTPFGSNTKRTPEYSNRTIGDSESPSNRMFNLGGTTRSHYDPYNSRKLNPTSQFTGSNRLGDRYSDYAATEEGQRSNTRSHWSKSGATTAHRRESRDGRPTRTFQR